MTKKPSATPSPKDLNIEEQIYPLRRAVDMISSYYLSSVYLFKYRKDLNPGE